MKRNKIKKNVYYLLNQQSRILEYQWTMDRNYI